MKVKAFLADPHEHFEDYHAVYEDRFSAPSAHTVLGMAQLAGPEYLVEIETTVSVEE